MSSDSAGRVGRTVVQVATIQAVLAVLLAFGVPLTDPQQKAILGLGTILITALQVVLEDGGAIPTLARPPSA